jgi:hypothetical protein
MRQITESEAIKIYESGLYNDWTDREKCDFQLFQDRLAMPFGCFKEAMKNCLGRPVFSHEFSETNRSKLTAEYLGERQAPTFDEIVAILSPEKIILVENLPSDF